VIQGNGTYRTESYVHDNVTRGKYYEYYGTMYKYYMDLNPKVYDATRTQTRIMTVLKLYQDAVRLYITADGSHDIVAGVHVIEMGLELASKCTEATYRLHWCDTLLRIEIPFPHESFVEIQQHFPTITRETYDTSQMRKHKLYVSQHKTQEQYSAFLAATKPMANYLETSAKLQKLGRQYWELIESSRV
jgi:hypothetical protein